MFIYSIFWQHFWYSFFSFSSLCNSCLKMRRILRKNGSLNVYLSEKDFSTLLYSADFIFVSKFYFYSYDDFLLALVRSLLLLLIFYIYFNTWLSCNLSTYLLNMCILATMADILEISTQNPSNYLNSINLNLPSLIPVC